MSVPVVDIISPRRGNVAARSPKVTMSYSSAFSQAIVTLVFVGDKVRQGHFDFVPTSVISTAMNLKTPTLVKILRQLSLAAVIETREGARGGVRLQRDPGQVTLLDVFDAIEARRPLFQCHLGLGATGEKPERAKRELLRLMGGAERAVRADLAKTTIADVIRAINAA